MSTAHLTRGFPPTGTASTYNLFEFDVSGLSLNNFSLYWKGMGTTQPKMGFSGSNIKLYMYNAASGQWEEYYSMAHPSLIEMDKEAWFNESNAPNDYIDGRGAITMMATVSFAAWAATMDTDYVSLTYAGNATLYPGNVTLDIGADGIVDWQNKGQLVGRVSVAGASLVAAVQSALDAGTTDTVLIPFNFSCKTAGILYLSNLSIIHGPKNLPPVQEPSIPVIEMDEGQNGTGLLDLWHYFSDDGGVANLTYGIVYQSDATKVRAQLESDGHRVDFSLPTPYWFGEQRFRVRATDRQGLWVESNTFTARVRFVDHPPVLEAVGSPAATFGVPFVWAFRATDPDMQFDPNESLAFSLNSSLLALDPATGRANFTPVKRDVGAHPMTVTVTDRYGSSASRDFTLTVGNVNSPPEITGGAGNFEAVEDGPFVHQFTATDPDLEIGQDSLSWSVNTTLFAISADGTINWTPDDQDIGSHRFTVTVKDQAGLTDDAAFTINVSDRPEPPVLLPVANQTVDEDTNVTFRLYASDEDPGDVLSFSSDWPPLSINATGWASFRADDKEVGVHVVKVTVRDRTNLTATATFTITVRPVNEPPANVVISGPANGTKFKQGALVAFAGSASDEDGDALNYTWSADGSVIGYGKTFSTKSLKPGKHEITLSVSDGNLTAASAPVQIEITKKPAPASKGFMPGFELAGVLAAGLLAVLVLRRRMR
jgi:hypothetical protein